MEINYDAQSRMVRPFPAIRKLGAVSPNQESSPFSWRFPGGEERLMRLELADRSIRSGFTEPSFAVIRDCETGRILSRVGEGGYYHSFFKDGDRACVLCTKPDRGTASDEIWIYESSDLLSWRGRRLLSRPGWQFYNTSLTLGPEGYLLLLEAGAPARAVGDHPFTMFFARSEDMIHWTFLPDDTGYPMDRYAGGPYLRYSRGWYYLVLLEQLPQVRYASYIYRSRDLRVWEVGAYNPILMPGQEDKAISPQAHDLDPAARENIARGFISSASDFDMCGFRGKTVITYNAGNQLGFAYIAQAEYDGEPEDFLEAWFL